MSPWLKIATFAVVLFTSCNYTVGECWVDGQGEGTPGVGGGPIVPGQGGFGDVPPKPQDDSSTQPPDCNIVAQGPCMEKCLAGYEAEAAKCGKVEDASQRSICQSSAHAAYKGCRDACTAKLATCTDMFDACQDKGYPCTRQTKWGTTLCAVCREDCQADAPYRTKECFDCGFK